MHSKKWLVLSLLGVLATVATAQNPFPGEKYEPRQKPPTTIMEVNGLKAEFNMPPALESKYGPNGEMELPLPPFAKRPVFRVDDYPNAPKDWIRSSSEVATYFVPVKANHGMWLDFNLNGQNDFHVATVLSIQGINPLTGQKAVTTMQQFGRGATDTCPIHAKEKLSEDLACPQCKVKIAPQNYLATTGTPYGMFWLDGFRAEDGQTRQWVFTEDALRSVARARIGDERVQAIGVTFYLSKTQRERPAPATRGMSKGLEAAPSMDVAAGAKIRQQVYRDQQRLDFWQPKPAGSLIIYYVDEDMFKTIVGEKGTGFLAEVPVGN